MTLTPLTGPSVSPGTGGSSNRMNNVTIKKSIIVGTFSFQKVPENGGSSQAFRWTILVRSGESEDEDLSEYIRRIEFNLHSTFAQPRRVVETPPFQVEEQGWGEFEINLRIFFQDTNERPLEMKHWLKLRPDDNEQIGIDHTKIPLVYDTFEEILFHSPHEWFYEKLCPRRPPQGLAGGSVFLPTLKISQHPLRPFMKSIETFREEESECEQKLLDLEKFLRVQINNHQSQILLVDSDYRAYRDHFYKYNISG
jgi:YEATS domain-containing protein 4